MTLDKKQKIMIPLVILAFAFLGWESYKLLGGGQSGGYTPPPAPVQAQNAPVAASPQPAVSTPSNPPATTQVGQTTGNVSAISGSNTQQRPGTPAANNLSRASNAQAALSSTDDNDIRSDSHTSDTRQIDNQDTLTPQAKAALAQQKALETQYVQLVTQYQLAQMQKKLADANAQLAQSKLREAQAVAKASSQNINVNAANAAGATSTASHILSGYSLLYVGYMNHEWMATLRYAGQLHNVHVGAQFADGTTVKVIDRNGVVLTNGQISRYLTISVPMTLTDEAAKESIKTTNKNTQANTSDTNARTTQSAQQVYNTLSQIQQAVPK